MGNESLFDGSSMKTYSRLLLAFLLLILVVPPVVADNPPKGKPRVRYYKNGNKQVESHWNNGKKDGMWTAWYESGKKRSEGHYKNGHKVSSKKF